MNPFRCATIALLLACFVSFDAHADNEEERRSAFEAGRSAIQEKRWEDAHRIFSDLFRGQRTYDVALHLGQVEFHLKHFRDAASHLAYGMMLLPPREKPEIAERGKAILELCKREVGTLELSVKNKNAVVLVDGNAVAEAPLVTDTYVDPGQHHFEVKLDGYQSEQWDAEFAQGSTQQRIVLLKARASTATTPVSPGAAPLVLSTATTSPGKDSTGTEGSWAPVAVGGALSLVGIGAGLGFALVRGSLTTEAKSLRGQIHASNGSNGCNGDSAPVELCSQLQKKNSDYDSYGTLEAVSFGLGGAALIATTTYFFLARPDQNRAVSTSQSTPLRLDGSFGKGSAGFRIIATF